MLKKGIGSKYLPMGRGAEGREAFGFHLKTFNIVKFLTMHS